MKSKIILAATITAVIFSSCATRVGVQKRKYTKGYHVSVTHKNKVENKHEREKDILLAKHNESVNAEIINASAEIKTINTIAFAKAAPISMVIEKSTEKKEVNVVTASAKQKTVAVLKKAFKPVLVVKNQLNSKSSNSSDGMLVLEIILCFFWVLNLISIFLHDNKAITLNFWITLILDLLLWIPGLVFSLLVVLDILNLDK